MRRYRLLVFCWVLLYGLLSGVTLGQDAAANSPNTWLGINLAGIADWSTEYPFADLFKTARPWISQREGAEWGEGGALALTPEGWVAALEAGQYAETLLMSADPAHAAGLDGEYTLLYDGEGEIAFRGSNVSIVSATPGRMIVEAYPTQGAIFLQVVATDAANPLRNIRFLLPGSEATYATHPFNPTFLERIAPFRVLRFMDWMATNNSIITTWAERPQMTDATYAERGAPVEVMVQLANTLHTDMWVTMPHAATDDYVREFAALVHTLLDPDLRVYIEYSNETWNGQFQQAQYVVEQGLALDLAEGDEFWGGLRFHAQRAVAIFALWEEAFGGTERLVRVLASQAANAWTGEQIALWQDAYQHADALAIAPYFSCDDPGNPAALAETSQLSVDALLDRQAANVAVGGCAHQYMLDNAAVAEEFGLALVAYEGGQHLAGYGGAEQDETLTALFIAANRHPRMGAIYEQYLDQWQSAGGGLFMLFSDIAPPSQFGSWGLLESISQDPATAPKYQAVLAAMQP